MKVLTVTPNYWPAFLHGGPVFSLYYLNRALSQKGIDVSVYTTNVDLSKETPANQEISVGGAKVSYFAFSKLFEFITPFGWQFSLPISRALKRNLKSFDLVYIATVWSYPTVIAAYYSRLYKKPYIIAPRGMLSPDLFYKKAWKKWPYYQCVIKKALRGASAIHYTSDKEAEETHSFFGLKNRAVVIPNGVELSDFSNCNNGGSLATRYPETKNKKIILFLGRLNWKKGLDILIEAYSKLAKERNDVHLFIAGSDEKGYKKRVQNWVRKHNLSLRITISGMLTGEQKLEAYAGSDIFVLPSYSENFGMTVVEAMACSVPVVISNKVGIYKEVEQNNAGIIIDTNADSLYKGMKLLLENPDLSKEMALNGRKLAERLYDIDKVADKMIEVYREILK